VTDAERRAATSSRKLVSEASNAFNARPSISISPTTAPLLRIGITISAFVSIKQARY